jgi:hypothetical protein
MTVSPGTTRCRCLLLKAICSPSKHGQPSAVTRSRSLYFWSRRKEKRMTAPSTTGAKHATCARKHRHHAPFCPPKAIIPMGLSMRGAAFFESPLNPSTAPCNQSYLFNSGVVRLVHRVRYLEPSLADGPIRHAHP